MSISTGPLIEFTYGLQGTYLIFLSVKKEIEFERRGTTSIINRGFYIYVGSAFGAGGLSSRLHRHIRKRKGKHWHIDQITMHEDCNILGIAISINKRTECSMLQSLKNIDEFSPVLGFGNSDCKNNCQSHFLKFSS